MLIVVGARSSGTKLVVQPFQPGLTITFAPLADGRRSHTQASCNGGVGQTLGARQNDPRALDQPARERPGPADLGGLGQICVTEFKGSDLTTSWQWGHTSRGAHIVPLTCGTAHPKRDGMTGSLSYRRRARARDHVAEAAYDWRVDTERGVRAADERSRS